MFESFNSKKYQNSKNYRILELFARSTFRTTRNLADSHTADISEFQNFKIFQIFYFLFLRLFKFFEHSK